MKTEKKKVKGQKARIAGKIIAAIMAVAMLLAACSSVIYYIIYNA